MLSSTIFYWIPQLLEPLLALKDVIEADICIKIVMLLLDIAIRQKRTQQAVLVFEDLCCIQEMIKSGSQSNNTFII